MRTAVIGAGHVGVPTAAALAAIGHDVAATDSDPEKIAALGDGRVPFHEPGLESLVRDGIDAGRLRFVSGLGQAVGDAEVAFLCVGTPARASGEANLLMVERAAAGVAQEAAAPMVIVEKSTVPAGTAERVRATMSRHRPELDFMTVSNPEFLREGHAVEDALRPNRILVGADSEQALAIMRELYEPMVRQGAHWIETDLRTAELAKHACNAFLALKVSFANALARLAEAAGADVLKVTETMGADPRIGPGHLRAGLGYGGYCLPKDLQAFETLATRLGYSFPLLPEIARINEEAIEAAFRKVEDAVWNLEGKRIALLGLAFKPETDDVRFSPALKLAERLLDAGADVIGYDPEAGRHAKGALQGLEVVTDAYAALEGAHCAVIATEWGEFSRLDMARAKELMAFPILVDGRNCLDPSSVREAGFTYIPMGRPVIPS